MRGLSLITYMRERLETTLGVKTYTTSAPAGDKRVIALILPLEGQKEIKSLDNVFIYEQLTLELYIKGSNGDKEVRTLTNQVMDYLGGLCRFTFEDIDDNTKVYEVVENNRNAVGLGGMDQQGNIIYKVVWSFKVTDSE